MKIGDVWSFEYQIFDRLSPIPRCTVKDHTYFTWPVWMINPTVGNVPRLDFAD